MKQLNAAPSRSGKAHGIPFRCIAAFALAALEVAAVVALTATRCRYIPGFYLLAWCTEIACVIRIISSDDSPDYKAPWLLIVLVLPVAGFMLYFMFYSRRLKKKYVRRMQEIKDSAYHRDDTEALHMLQTESPVACGQVRLLCGIAETHLFTDTKQTYFPLGEAMHPAMLADLRQAERFIFLEYFIIEEGLFWNAILDILREKAAHGVEVRLVYDDMGCMTTLPGHYARTLNAWGIRAVPFSVLRGNADSEINNRSHRKLLIIDRKVGYTGGINLADEYINAYEKYGHWKDTGVRLEGEAVWELTRLFLLDFGLNCPNAPALTGSLFPASCRDERHGWTVPFGDGPRPIYPRWVGKSVIQSMLASAVRSAWITTPYLIIGDDLCQALENAALRGVDVRIIVPHIPDKRLVFEMARSYYPRLMAAGVKLYEYAPGFIHAKSYLVDDEIAMIGTINLDYRCLVHHFENGVWMYRCACIRDLKADMEATLARCIPVGPAQLQAGMLRRLLRAVLRIFVPML